MKPFTVVYVLTLLSLTLFLSCEKENSPTALKNEGTGTKEARPLYMGVPDILVTTTSDVADFGGTQQIGDLPGLDGLVSLREAIIAANNTTGPQVIGFNIPTSDPGFDGFVFTIQPQPEQLPILADGGTTIDGASQAVYTGNTNERGPEIALDGSLINASNYPHGLLVASANNHIHCLAVANFQIGIGIGGANNTIITGCFVGVDPTGTEARPNRSWGISSANFQSGTSIGGPTPDERNVISGNADAGIFLSNFASDCTIENNIIGTDVTGQRAIPNGFGITNGNNCNGTTVKNNLISGNYAGIFISLSSHISIENNMIGTDMSGQIPLGNQIGIWAWSKVSYLTVKNNLISASSQAGIRLDGGSDYVITGNIVGGDKNGNIFQDIPKPVQGIVLNQGGSDDASVARVTIGGLTEREGNLVVGNQEGITMATTVDDIRISRNKMQYNLSGIHIYAKNNPKRFIAIGNEISFNWIGVNVKGMGISYTISQNRIFSNELLGIDLTPNEWGTDGVTPNDPGDVDIGPNNFMNFPVLTSALATPGRLVVKGTIDTPNPRTVTIEFFANPVPNPGGDPTGYGEGATYLGSDRPNQQGKFTATLPTVAAGTLITATATDAEGNTSEFSAYIAAR